MATGTEEAKYKPFSPLQSMGLVFGCTILGAAAQMLMKIGMQGAHPQLMDYVLNLPLFGGYCLYGVSALLLTLALRDGELSLLYPVIALTYVWVTMLAVPVLHETMNPFKVTGIIIIVAGVGVLGLGHKR
jgi:multidrug transporter EmrE-like cation transporter